MVSLVVSFCNDIHVCSLGVSHGSFYFQCALRFWNDCVGSAKALRHFLNLLSQRFCFSPLFPLSALHLCISQREEALSQRSRPWCSLQQQRLHQLRSLKPADTLTCARLHWTNVCSGAAEQEKQQRSCPSPSLHFWGWGESRRVAAVVLGFFFIFSLFPTLYPDSCLSPPPFLTEQRQE